MRGVLTAVLAVLVAAPAAWPAVSPKRPSLKERVSEAVTGYILANSPWKDGELVVEDVVLRGGSVEGDFDELSIRSPSGLDGAAAGRVSVAVRLVKDGSEVGTVWATAVVRLYRDVVVALRRLRINDRIGPGDVRVARVESRQIPATALGDPAQAVGMLVKRPIRAGAVISSEYVKPEPLVMRGDRVTVLATSGAVRIKLPAVALEDGHAGATIGVRMSTGKRVAGRVESDGTVTVVF
ncbi:MAG TPA: flagellar basal body P-ring formation protein FlgA [Deltaproteobacteria bacterium]|nr:flagellar basal body P-ring formation protein FlgA [Deltaproteobacteria bacterium]